MTTGKKPYLLVTTTSGSNCSSMSDLEGVGIQGM